MRYIIPILWVTIASGLPSYGYKLDPWKIKTVTSQVSTSFNDVELELSVVTKKDAGIRATVFSPSGSHDAIILFDNKDIYFTRREGTKPEAYIQLSRRQAAENLFQMLALNPWLHFPDGKLNLDCPALDSYIIVFDYILKDNHLLPTTMYLFELADEKKNLISTIKFVDFFTEHTNLLQPKLLRVTDHTNQLTGKVTVKNFTYNLGIGDYIFDAHEAANPGMAEP
jgi:hypothetical protein